MGVNLVQPRLFDERGPRWSLLPPRTFTYKGHAPPPWRCYCYPWCVNANARRLS